MFYLVDKPTGPSSNQTLLHIRRMFGTKKAGFAGTLDPLASGLLIVATNGSTKLLSFLEGLDKTYRFTFDITRTSDSLDLGTEPSPLNPDHPVFKHPPTEIDIQDSLEHFIGEIDQVPPTYSAIWINGKRAYAEARKGEEVKLASRKARIHEIRCISYNFPYIELEASVSSGTYIRSLARDIGISLGATWLVTSLRRTRIWHLRLDEKNMTYSETRNNELTGISEVSYPEIFPEIGRRDLTPEECILAQNGQPIEGTHVQELVFGYNALVPFCLLRNSANSWLHPIRCGIS